MVAEAAVTVAMGEGGTGWVGGLQFCSLVGSRRVLHFGFFSILSHIAASMAICNLLSISLFCLI